MYCSSSVTKINRIFNYSSPSCSSLLDLTIFLLSCLLYFVLYAFLTALLCAQRLWQGFYSVQGDSKSGETVCATSPDWFVFTSLHPFFFPSSPTFVTLLLLALFPVDMQDSVTTHNRPQLPRSSFSPHCLLPRSSSVSAQSRFVTSCCTLYIGLFFLDLSK